MVNSVVLVGRLTRDPELRKTQSGTSVTSFTIACDDSRKGPDGEKVTIFMNVSAFGNSADVIVKYAHKGSLVGVIGRLTQHKYVRKADNVEVTSTDIAASQVEFMEPKKASQGDAASDPAAAPAAAPKKDAAKPTANLDNIDVVDDDLPF
jgi:single-strand DNA-binding protein